MESHNESVSPHLHVVTHSGFMRAVMQLLRRVSVLRRHVILSGKPAIGKYLATRVAGLLTGTPVLSFDSCSVWRCQQLLSFITNLLSL